MSSRSSIVVISAAVIVGVALAGGAWATNFAVAAAPRDESESADPRSTASSDNPYDEPAPARMGLARVSVPSQD
jgi:hypothetical protein